MASSPLESELPSSERVARLRSAENSGGTGPLGLSGSSPRPPPSTRGFPITPSFTSTTTRWVATGWKTLAFGFGPPARGKRELVSSLRLTTQPMGPVVRPGSVQPAHRHGAYLGLGPTGQKVDLEGFVDFAQRYISEKEAEMSLPLPSRGLVTNVPENFKKETKRATDPHNMRQTGDIRTSVRDSGVNGGASRTNDDPDDRRGRREDLRSAHGPDQRHRGRTVPAAADTNRDRSYPAADRGWSGEAGTSLTLHNGQPNLVDRPQLS